MAADDGILETLNPLDERDGDKLKVFIPAGLAARCCDCEGTFLRTVGRCPGCGSSSYVLDSRIQPRRAEA